uniref:Uncharacterized protein n=1 Tax=Leersia perrieri TaxID=77586 RepID=A0A0D9UZB4_9ORYZ
MPARSLEATVVMMTNTIPRAIELSEDGVTFIWRSAVEDRYVLPSVGIDNILRSLVANLIAFEQTQGELTEPRLLIGYMALMSQLVAQHTTSSYSVDMASYRAC